MLPNAVNYMTLAKNGTTELLDITTHQGCCGVELRNDLTGSLIDGLAETSGQVILVHDTFHHYIDGDETNGQDVVSYLAVAKIGAEYAGAA